MFTKKIYYIVITSVVLWPIYHNISYIYRLLENKKNVSTQTDFNVHKNVKTTTQDTQTTKNTRDVCAQTETNINNYIIVEYCPRV